MPGRVLVAEDSNLLAALLKDALRAHGIADQVDVFKDGGSILDAYQTLVLLHERATLLVLDIQMPGPSGLVVGRTCRAYERQAKLAPAPIVFFSGRTEDDEIKAAVVDCFPARYVQKQGQGGPAAVALEGVKLIRSLLSGQ